MAHVLQSAARRSMGTPLRVLLVEDSHPHAAVLQQLIEDFCPGAQPTTVRHSPTLAGACAQLATDHVDAVLLDLGLPDSAGFDTLTRLRAVAPNVPVVVLTGTEDDALGIRAIQAGAYEYLVKGQIDERAIARTLRHAVEQQRVKDALRHSEEQTREAQKLEAVGRLAAGIAHDFNNLLTAIIGYSELVKDGLPPGGAARRDIGEVLSAAHRAATLTRELLAFGRRQMLLPEMLSLGSVVRDMRRVTTSLIGPRIELKVYERADVPLVSADRGQIERVLVELALNARDAMPDGGTLTIEVSTGYCEWVDQGAAPCAVLTVSDTGRGMDADALSRIFEPFYSTNASGRSGLGLSTVYGVVRQTGGHVEARSEPGRGTTFRMCFKPADEKSASPPAASLTSTENA